MHIKVHKHPHEITWYSLNKRRLHYNKGLSEIHVCTMWILWATKLRLLTPSGHLRCTFALKCQKRPFKSTTPPLGFDWVWDESCLTNLISHKAQHRWWCTHKHRQVVKISSRVCQCAQSEPFNMDKHKY